MAHISEKLWGDVNQVVGQSSSEIVDVLNRAEERYNQLLELWEFAGGTDQLVADQLFEDINGTGNPATTDQVSKVTDAKNALVAAHQLWQALNNVDISADDRASKLRRMV